MFDHRHADDDRQEEPRAQRPRDDDAEIRDGFEEREDDRRVAHRHDDPQRAKGRPSFTEEPGDRPRRQGEERIPKRKKNGADDDAEHESGGPDPIGEKHDTLADRRRYARGENDKKRDQRRMLERNAPGKCGTLQR